MANKRIQLVLKQIAVSNEELFGLDKGGRVWKYSPSKGTRKSFWTQLTAYASMWVPDGDEKGE